jgi:hypothetical protein
MSVHEFRKYADECLASAKTARSDKDRRDFLRMAEAWLQAAALLEQPPPARNGKPHTLDQSGKGRRRPHLDPHP